MKERNMAGDPIPVLQEAPPSRELPRAERLTHDVVVTYYGRMKMNRVFPMVVELKRITDKETMIFSGPVQIRPVVPGAQVTPELREVNPGNSDAVSTFYVTPLARGRRPDARVGIYQNGQRLQEVNLPVKGVRQRMTWLLLALTILIPCLVHYFTTTVDFSVSAAKAKTTIIASRSSVPEKMPRAEEAVTDAGSARAMEIAETKRAAMGAAVARAPAPRMETPEIPSPTYHQGVLEKEINQNVPDFGEFVQVYAPNFPGIRKPAAHGIQQGYEFLQDWEKELHLSRYLFFVLLALTIVSWVTHASQRSRRQAGAIALEG